MDKDEQGRGESLTPAQHRARLLNKLNCLIAVLEVAIAKIQRTQAAPAANQERLDRIRANLENTLAICHRARTTLEDQLGRAAVPAVRPEAAPPAPGRNSGAPPGRMSFRDYVELSSVKEYQKFKTLPPIQSSDLAGQDLDDLIRKLLAG